VRNNIVCIDTNIFGWVFRDSAPPKDQENLIKYQKAKRLIKSLMRKGYIIMIPDIVLAESFCIYSETEQSRRFDKYNENDKFYKASFTFTTARILSRILHHRYHKEDKAYSEIDVEEKGEIVKMTKSMMKYDSFILACAVEHGADCFYTTDEGFSKYPTHFIPIKGLDDAPPSYAFEGFFAEDAQVNKKIATPVEKETEEVRMEEVGMEEE